MDQLYNNSVFLSFLGGLFSLAFTVVVLYIKQMQKRDYGRDLLMETYKNNPEIGDIDTKLDESLEYKKPIVGEIIAAWGLQPLYIIAFASLLNQTSYVEVIGIFALTIIVLLHEFLWERKYSKVFGYQLFIMALWIIFYVLITLKTNEKISRNPEDNKIKKKDVTLHVKTLSSDKSLNL
jgi:hypothetical protein